MSLRRILVPRHVDAQNINAQNLNARALLARFSNASWCWLVTRYGAADPAVLANPRIGVLRLWRRRFWRWRLWLFYQQPAAALFYPGIESSEVSALRWSKRLYPRRPVIATLEGLAGDAERERALSALAGHPVPCQYVTPEQLANIDAMLRLADHVIAISPFLAELGTAMYGPKFSVLPLGIDTARFHPPATRPEGRLRVVSAGTLTERKRPAVFVELAARHPGVEFVWYGTGPLLAALQKDVAGRKLGNVCFAGPVQPDALAEAFRSAHLFVLPSLSEGVPKVTQEAAACGLPVVLFGNYRAPSVTHEVNGLVVWNDAGFFAACASLLDDQVMCRRLGDAGAALARHWDWAVVAPQWEALVLAQAERLAAVPRRPA